MATKHLNRSEFLNCVANIEVPSAEWNFLGSRPAVVDFYAEWCGPCKRLLPVLEKISEEFDGRVDIYKVNVDEEPELAEAFGIQTIPTLLFIPKNGMPRRVVGGMPENILRETIGQLLD